MKALYSVILLAFLTGLYENAAGQTFINLQPDSTTGKDALIFMRTLDASVADINFGSDGSFEAVAWTWNAGDSGVIRCLLQFDLTFIPVGSIIQNAQLFLYNNPTSSESNGEQSSLSGSNTSVLQKITSAWNESTVTWNNQPSTTTANEVVLAQSTSIHEDYPNIDVTALVADMVANPSNNFGFMIKLQDEFHYRSMIFASSDNADSTLHPKLEITYSPLSVNELTDNTLFDIYPNPSEGVFFVKYHSYKTDISHLKIENVIGQKIVEENIPATSSGKFEINLTGQPKGIYFITFSEENRRCVKKLVVE